MAIDLLTYEFLKRYVEGSQMGQYAKPQGVWDSEKTYSTGDYVTYENTVYIVPFSLQTSTDGSQTERIQTVEGDTPGTDETKWQKIAGVNVGINEETLKENNGQICHNLKYKKKDDNINFGFYNTNTRTWQTRPQNKVIYYIEETIYSEENSYFRSIVFVYDTKSFAFCEDNTIRYSVDHLWMQQNKPPSKWEKISEGSGNTETINLNIENGPVGYGSNNLQQKPEIKDGTTEATKSWSSQNVEVQNWKGTNGQDNSTINRDGNNIQIGAFAKENGGNAAVFGGKSQASGGKSFAAGSKNIALGNNSAAFGNENFAAGQHSFTTGQQNAALGNSSWAAGTNTVAKNTDDMTIGYKTTAVGHKPEDIGNNNYHPNYQQPFPQFIVGRLNEEDTDFSKDINNDANGLNIFNKKAFIVGNGVEKWGGQEVVYEKKNAASIDYNGNMELAGGIILTDTEDSNAKYKITITKGEIKCTKIES